MRRYQLGRHSRDLISTAEKYAIDMRLEEHEYYLAAA